jgi:DGQHR domain-containing protein
MNDFIECPAFEVTQPVGTFYVARISPEDLIYITFVDVRTIEKEDRGIERVLGIQRPLSESRVKEINQYVNLYDASFPSSIIVSLSSFSPEDDSVRNAYFNKATNVLKIRRDQKIAKVLDGQHRIEGLGGLQESNKPFELIITVFVDADIEQQAMLFATINKSQTKVNKSLVYDLFELAKNRSPEKTAHNIAVLLNRKEGSPFKDMVKILGTADDAAKETITQATFVESLLRHITNDPVKDRDFIRRNPAKDIPPISADDSKKFVLRALFAKAQDAKIAKTVWNYFQAVAEKWPDAWRANERGMVLNRSTGLIALMRLLRPIYLHYSCPADELSVEQYRKLLKSVSLKNSDFSPDRFLPGSTGQGLLYRTLLAEMGLKEP